MKKNALIYILTLIIFGSGIYFIINAGKHLESARPVPAQAAVATPTSAAPNQLIGSLRDNLREPLPRLLVQLILIVVLARLFGAAFIKMRQPAVIGEMLAGIILGPSVIGTALPGAFHFVFPADSLGALRMLSQVGVIMFMFVVGMELDLKHVRQKAGPAILVSHISIVFPYFLGVLFSYFIYEDFAVANTRFLPFALFMGIAMSITAFPVLARILEDRNMTQTFLGATAITCAAIGDVSAWGILAVVVAIVKAGGMGTAVATMSLAVLFAVTVLLVVKPLLAKFFAAQSRHDEAPTRGTIVGVLVLVFCCALFTEIIGMHALFGAFLVGVAMPADERFRAHLKEKLESFSSAFLLPLFFAFTGLRTQIGLLNGWADWMICIALVLIATLGKLGGSMVTARLTGMNWRDSFALGALMNTRGLVELIVLNIGLDLGIISPQVFAMTVIMALVTTGMTGPLLSLAQSSVKETSDAHSTTAFCRFNAKTQRRKEWRLTNLSRRKNRARPLTPAFPAFGRQADPPRWGRGKPSARWNIQSGNCRKHSRSSNERRQRAAALHDTDAFSVVPFVAIASWSAQALLRLGSGTDWLIICAQRVRIFLPNKIAWSDLLAFDCVVIETVSETGSAAADLKKSQWKKAAFSDAAPRLDRLPPHSIEAEQGVLGCVLLSPNDCVGECVEKFKAGGEVFYDLRHQTIFETLVAMYDAREAIDIITLQQHLKNKQRLDEVGGLAYLNSLPDMVPSAANLTYYLDIVLEKYVLRRMIHTCTEVVSRVYDHEGEVDTLLDEVERDILRISEARVEEKSDKIKELVKKAISTIEDYHQRQGMLTGVATGFADLDKMTSGLHGGEMIVIAARPSMGKTSLAMNIAEHVAIEEKIPVGVFSLEMTSDSLVLRMLCSRSRVNLRNVREGFLAERDFPKLTGAAGKLANAPLFIDDSSGLSILQLRAKARRMWQQYGIKLFVIDYLQLLHSTARRAENRQQEIADISNGIKSLAKELDVPVIVLSQLNRELEKDKDRKPRLSDLRESGAIEQDADVVGLLYKPSRGDDEEGAGGGGEEQDATPVNLLIAKQRNGPTGDVNLTFLKSYTRFESAAKISQDDLPQ